MAYVIPSSVVKVQGVRGKSVADILRVTGQFGVRKTDTDAEVMDKFAAAAAAAGVPIAMQPYMDSIEMSVAQAEAYALLLTTMFAGYKADSLADGQADPEIPVDGVFLVIEDATGRIFWARKGVAVSTIIAEFLTTNEAETFSRSYATRAEIAALDTMKHTSAILTEDSRQGSFIYTPGYFVQEVSADTQQGVYITSESDPTGATGAWVRVFDGLSFSPKWFGAKADGLTNDRVAVQCAIDSASLAGGRVVVGGPDEVYLIGGDFATYGTFTYADGSTVGFKRGLLRIRSNVTISGNKAVFRLAPGYHDPGGMFYGQFWTDGQLENFVLENIEVDGNMENQTFTSYAAQTPDNNWWQQGHGLVALNLKNFRATNVEMHGFWGHGFFASLEPTFNVRCDDWIIKECDVYNNLQGGAQLLMNRCRTIGNRWHGDGGMTAIGPNYETGSADYGFLDIWSIGDIFDGTDGLTPTLSFVHGEGSFTGYDSDSPEAYDARVHLRRGIMFSGDFYTPAPFNGNRGRVHIVAPTFLQCNLVCGGVDWIDVEGIISHHTPEDASKVWPPVQMPVTFTRSRNATDVYSQVSVRGQLRGAGTASTVLISSFRCVNIDVTVEDTTGTPVRLEGCGGDVRVRAKDFGFKTDRAYWQALFPAWTPAECDARIGSTSSAVVCFGNSGPLDIRVNAIDTRGAGAQMQYAAYMNTSTGNVSQVSGSVRGALVSPVHDVNNSVFSDMIDGNSRINTVSGKVLFSSGLESHGPTAVRAESGRATLELYSPAGQASSVVGFTDNTYTSQVTFLSDGSTQINNTAGTIPVTFTKNGKMIIAASWEEPIQASGKAFMWVTSSGVWRTSNSAPTSETDGVVIGTQS